LRLPAPETTTQLKAGQALALTDTPVVVVGLPADLTEQARTNAVKNFPWGGDHSQATSVSFQAGLPDKAQGVFPLGRSNFPTVTFADGSSGLLMQGDISRPISFFVHPSFASFPTREYYVRVTVRRLVPGNVGMNLLYEVADSQGRSPYANVGRWFGLSGDTGWQTHTWHVTDACFAKMWGYDLTVRPEQSVPLVIGKVEVSTRPFE